MKASQATPPVDPIGSQGDDLDLVWRGLSNPVRRRILDHLREGPRTTGDLVLLFPELSRFAVMQHLEVLVEANLVVVTKSGRLRFNHLNAVPIRRIYERWVSRYAGHWSGALLAIQSAAESGNAVVEPIERAEDRSRRARLGAADRQGDRT